MLNSWRTRTLKKIRHSKRKKTSLIKSRDFRGIFCWRGSKEGNDVCHVWMMASADWLQKLYTSEIIFSRHFAWCDLKQALNCRAVSVIKQKSTWLQASKGGEKSRKTGRAGIEKQVLSSRIGALVSKTLTDKASRIIGSQRWIIFSSMDRADRHGINVRFNHDSDELFNLRRRMASSDVSWRMQKL